MLNLLFRIMLVVIAIIAVVAVIGSLIPRNYDIRASVQIEAPPEDVFPLINQIRNWEKWSMWSPERVENLTVKYAGNEAGIGAEQIWTEARGTGRIKITSSIPEQRVEFRLDFMNFEDMRNLIELEDGGQMTTVTWSSSGELPGGPFYGYFGSLFSNGMQMQYQQALNELKNVVESD